MDPTVDPNDPYATIAMLMQLAPEIRKGVEQPMDGSYQQDQLDFRDDQLNTLMDPAFFAGIAGGMDMSAFEPTFEEETVLGDRSGRTKLEKIAASQEGSVEGLIAQLLLEGFTASQAVDSLTASGKIAPTLKPKKNDDDVDEYDTSVVDRARAFAEKSWDGLLSDTEDVTTRTEVPSALMEKFTKAGFTDPRQQYTADYINPGLGQFDQQAAMMKTLYDSALTSRDRKSERVGGPSDGASATSRTPIDFQGKVPDALQAVYDAGNMPAAWQNQLGLGGQMSKGAPLPGWAGGLDPAKTQSPSNFTSSLGKSSASRHKGRVESAPDRRAELGSKAAHAGADMSRSQAEAGMQRMRAEAVSRFLSNAGRTPFTDQYTARLQGTR